MRSESLAAYAGIGTEDADNANEDTAPMYTAAESEDIVESGKKDISSSTYDQLKSGNPTTDEEDI